MAALGGMTPTRPRLPSGTPNDRRALAGMRGGRLDQQRKGPEPNTALIYSERVSQLRWLPPSARRSVRPTGFCHWTRPAWPDWWVWEYCPNSERWSRVAVQPMGFCPRTQPAWPVARALFSVVASVVSGKGRQRCCRSFVRWPRRLDGHGRRVSGFSRGSRWQGRRLLAGFVARGGLLWLRRSLRLDADGQYGGKDRRDEVRFRLICHVRRIAAGERALVWLMRRSGRARSSAKSDARR